MSTAYADLPEMNMAFSGAKLAILVDGCVLTILRDEHPGIPWPGHWDLPGGGREGRESPLACALRETQEELALNLSSDAVRWGRCYGGGRARTWFFACRVRSEVLSEVRLGNEGQRWCAMPVAEFVSNALAVPHFRSRLSECLASSALTST